MRKVGIILILAAACSNNSPAPPERVAESAPSNPPSEVLSAVPDFPVTSTTVTEPEPPPLTIPAPPPTPTTTVPTPVAPRPTVTTRPPRSPSSELASIRACESGGDYSINTGNGYYGAYQFSLSTWQSVGGSGYPHLASPAEQDMRAQIMINQGRRGEWPSC